MLIALALSGCKCGTPSATLRPFSGVKAGITLDPGARFLTGATLRLTLECRTEEFNFLESGGSQNQAQLKLRTATQRVSADRIEVELALDEAATVSAPPTHSVLDSQHCFAEAILQVTYQASPDVLVRNGKKLSYGGGTTQEWFTTPIARAAAKRGPNDFTDELVASLRSEFSIRCGPSSMFRHESSLYLRKLSPGGQQELGQVLGMRLKRGCGDP